MALDGILRFRRTGGKFLALALWRRPHGTFLRVSGRCGLQALDRVVLALMA